MMMEYCFNLRYQLDNPDADPDALVERLGEGGCDDALVGIGLRGRLALAFSREAATAEEAMFSAIKDVWRAVPELRLLEVSPDLVGLSDVAERMNCSRQNMRKLMLSDPAGFPASVHEGNSALWHLADVLGWMKVRGYAVPEEDLAVARLAMQVNLARSRWRVSPEVQSAVDTLFG